MVKPKCVEIKYSSDTVCHAVVSVLLASAIIYRCVLLTRCFMCKFKQDSAIISVKSSNRLAF
jgi:hypothetical protein